MERGQRMRKHIVRGGPQFSAESITTDLQTSCGLQISSTTELRELHGWVSMVEQLHPRHTSLSAMQSLVPSVKLGGGGMMVWGCSSGAGLGPLVPVKGTLDASADQDILDNSISYFVGPVWSWTFI